MGFKLNYKKGVVSFEYSFEEIKEHIETHVGFGEVNLTGFIKDENGNAVGIKGMADLGHGYGFDNGQKEFRLMLGDEFAFDHDFTSVDGPSDWSNESVHIVLKLAEE